MFRFCPPLKMPAYFPPAPQPPYFPPAPQPPYFPTSTMDPLSIAKDIREHAYDIHSRELARARKEAEKVYLTPSFDPAVSEAHRTKQMADALIEAIEAAQLREIARLGT